MRRARQPVANRVASCRRRAKRTIDSAATRATATPQGCGCWRQDNMDRGLRMLPALVVGIALFGAPAWAQVQSQPLPPPAGSPASPPATAPASPPATKTEPSKTPTPLTKPAPPAGTATTCPPEKVDINAASAEELRRLPQIGVQRSGNIVKTRPYATPEDLLKKKVLKKAVYDKIRTCITASGVEAQRPATKAPAGKPPAGKTPAAATSPTTPVPVPAPTSTESTPATKSQ
ncbi:MAG TPA: helix-hairpin-helix domain-containing protein [Vineibacter sp.]|nr:helix-hairpin-helix domain-containing protein [Vineibacter sp.]